MLSSTTLDNHVYNWDVFSYQVNEYKRVLSQSINSILLELFLLYENCNEVHGNNI
jgi:hypothetical protein